MWKDTGEPADSYYAVRSECTDVPKTRFKIKGSDVLDRYCGILKAFFIASAGRPNNSRAGKTLSERKWRAAFNPEGQLDISKTLSRIQRGGIHPTIRGEVWEFLLGVFDPNSTLEERDELRQRRREQYAIWKEECQSMDSVVGSGRIITAPIITEDGLPILDPLVLLEANRSKEQPSTAGDNDSNAATSGSEETVSKVSGSNSASTLERVTDKKIIQWKLTLHQIGLDVLRTDRTLVFYEKQENLSKLWDILAVYAWIDKDVGYCQDAYDICTESSVGVESQLSSLASITQVLDPKLHQHLETLGGGDYLFAFRMLMVLFRREFSFGDSLYLWEMMWALEYDPGIFTVYDDSGSEKSDGSKGKLKSAQQCGKFERENLRNGNNPEANLPISVFLVASVLKDKSAKLLQEARGLDDVVKILNDIAGNLDARKACTGAMKLHKKYLKKAKKP
ncbi:hypothetical protein ACLOJK_039549 [Asimina triloba]